MVDVCASMQCCLYNFKGTQSLVHVSACLELMKDKWAFRCTFGCISLVVTLSIYRLVWIACDVYPASDHAFCWIYCGCTQIITWTHSSLDFVVSLDCYSLTWLQSQAASHSGCLSCASVFWIAWYSYKYIIVCFYTHKPLSTQLIV